MSKKPLHLDNVSLSFVLEITDNYIHSLHFVFICSAEDLSTLTSNEFRMVYKVDGNSQLDSRDWSMYWNILNYYSEL